VKVFIAGIMQGSRNDPGIHFQTYRDDIAAVLRESLEAAEIVDPWALHPESVSYDDGMGKQTLLLMAAEAAQADLVVAYIPEATMGTAIEMWEAFRAGKPIVTISPLERNWVVRYLSTKLVPDLEAFREMARGGELADLLA
jgi:hypothetical protein